LAGIALPAPDVLTWRGAYGEELSVLLHDIIWRERFLLKIVAKHGVTADEVEEVLFTKPHVRLAEKGQVKGEPLYVAYGQTAAGRYLVVFFIRKGRKAAMPISARPMTRAEERYYYAQKEAD
jgi:uncharacterized DUF497 family protein